jgi:outer membrane protein assembly factor BamB
MIEASSGTMSEPHHPERHPCAGVSYAAEDSAPSQISAVDGATGSTRWTLEAPTPGSQVIGGALTSAGGIVALMDDRTLFGASD